MGCKGRPLLAPARTDTGPRGFSTLRRPRPAAPGTPAQDDAGLLHRARAAAAAGAAGLRAPQLQGAPRGAAPGRLNHLLPGAEVTARVLAFFLGK